MANDENTMYLATLSGLPGKCSGCGSSLMSDISIDAQLDQLELLLIEKMATGDLASAMVTISGAILAMCPESAMTPEQVQQVLTEEYAKSPSDVKGTLRTTLNRACAKAETLPAPSEAGFSPWLAILIVLGVGVGLYYGSNK